MSDEGSNNDPVIIDLGKHKRKKVKRLRKGKGVLVDKIDDVVEALVADGTLQKGQRPVIIVVRQKRRKRRMKFRMPRF